MISRFFIDRPIFAGVIALIMLLSGGLAIPLLPAEQYPQIAPPTVQVTGSYPGADAETVSESVAAPIEQEVNGVEGMLYMSSVSSSNGSYQLTVTFEVGTDLDLAAVRVQNRVQVAEPRLPTQVVDQGLTTRKQSTSLLMVIAPHSPPTERYPEGRYDQLFMSNYVTLYMKDPLARVRGVGRAQIFGSKDFAMRVWLDPDKLAARDLTTIDVISALREQNVQVAAGRLGSEPIDDEAGLELTLSTLGRLSSPEQFEDIVLRVGPGQRTVRLRDVARVELGARSYDQFARYNRSPSPVIGIFQTPGSNALEVSRGVRRKVEELRAGLPEGMEVTVFYDFTNFVRASIREVVTTLLIAFGLVFFTVFVFLQDWRATLIPAFAIPVSIVGAFAPMLAFGFSLNVLTLLAVVLAIGIVVDDAIVVVENTQRLIDDEDLDPKEAARKSMRQITGPVIATTLVLLAVFVPTSALPGISGTLYRQFGVTLSTATVLSSINALTLSPALCGLFLRRGAAGKKAPPLRLFNASLGVARSGYLWAVARVLRVGAIAVVLIAAVLGGTGYLLGTTPTGFIPPEDQSYLFINIELPPASKLARTGEVLREVEEKTLAVEGVEGVVGLGGLSLLTNASKPNTATVVAILEPWDQRNTPDTRLQAIVGTLRQQYASILEAEVFPFIPPPIQGLGQSGGFELVVQDRAARGPRALEQATRGLAGRASDTGEIARAFTGFSAEVPRLYLDIDRVKARRLGVPLEQVFATLASQTGSAFVNDFNLFGRVYQVRAQADLPFRDTVDDVLSLDVRNASGGTVPLRSFTEAKPTAGAGTVFRYNVFPSASINGQAAPGVSSGRSIALMDALADRELPDGFGYEWTGAAFQQIRAGDIAPLAFALAIVFVYLFLAAQYESWITPVAVLTTVPVGALGALALTRFVAGTNNIYTQVGLVLLIALVSKNAILVVEFAELRRKEGLSIREASEQAARLRFRPVLMTSFAFILGTLPLLIASGAGANARRSIGLAVFGGMLLASILGLLLIPTLYAVIRRLVALIETGPTEKAEAETPPGAR